MFRYRLSSRPAAENSTSIEPTKNARSCSSVVSYASFMSITMPCMIDPFIRVQTHTILNKTLVGDVGSIGLHFTTTLLEWVLRMTQTHSKRLILGITGGIAAFKSTELVPLLVQDGADVQVVMTRTACVFITPATFQELSSKPVFTDMWKSRVTDGMVHIALSRGAAAIVIALARADFFARVANRLTTGLFIREALVASAVLWERCGGKRPGCPA